MFKNFRVAECGIDPIDQKTVAGAHSGQHAGDEIGVIPVVVVGIGEHVDDHVGNAQGPFGHFPIPVAASRASVKIRCIQERQAGRQGRCVMQQWVARNGELFHLHHLFGWAAKSVE